MGGTGLGQSLQSWREEAGADIAPEAARRQFHGDCLRIIAAQAVVAVHVCAPLVARPGMEAVNWWASNVLASSVRWAVPVFVMLSGSLLLDPRRREPMRDFYRRRLARIGLPLLFWTAFYLARQAIGSSEIRRPGVLLSLLVSGRAQYHLYYLYVIGGLYAFTPALRLVVAGLDRGSLLRFAGLCLALAALRDAASMRAAPAGTIFSMFVPYLGYYLAGAGLRDVALGAAGRRAAWTALLASFAITAVGTWALARRWPLAGYERYLYGFHSPCTIAAAIAVFMLARAHLASAPARQPWIARHIQALADTTLGVYLIHPIILNPIRGIVESGPAPSWVMLIPAAVTVFGLSAAASALIKRAPLLRRVV